MEIKDLINEYKEFVFKIDKDVREMESKNENMSVETEINYRNCFQTFDGFMRWLEDKNNQIT